jgi:hypothetical protein
MTLMTLMTAMTMKCRGFLKGVAALFPGDERWCDGPGARSVQRRQSPSL